LTHKHKKIAIFEIKKNCSSVFFSSVFGYQYLGSRLDPDSLEMLDPDPYPDPDSMNPDPELCLVEN
jgi:hypothetical protein